MFDRIRNISLMNITTIIYSYLFERRQRMKIYLSNSNWTGFPQVPYLSHLVFNIHTCDYS